MQNCATHIWLETNFQNHMRQLKVIQHLPYPSSSAIVRVDEVAAIVLGIFLLLRACAYIVEARPTFSVLVSNLIIATVIQLMASLS
jgi:hypothetical protein